MQLGIIVAYAMFHGVASNVIDEPFAQEARTAYTFKAGIPANKFANEGDDLSEVRAIAVVPDGTVVASAVTELGNLYTLEFVNDKWDAVPFFDHIGKSHQHSLVTANSRKSFFPSDASVSPPPVDEARRVTVGALSPDGYDLVGTGEGVWAIPSRGGAQKLFSPKEPILALAAGPNGAIAVGVASGLYLCPNTTGEFTRTFPSDEKHSWAPKNVRAVAYDTKGRLWFGCNEGAGVLEGETWKLYTGEDGLPFNRFTCAAPGEDGVIWFGTERGAIRFDGAHWSYRASLRWLPDDHVTSIAVQPDGTAWIATPKGISRIERRPMTLEKKAEYFLDQVEKRHNRNGYVTNWKLTRQGDLSSAVPEITDNDGMYTAMYGAAMSFRFAVTGDAKAKELATRSFLACKRLVDIVPKSMKGFPARVIIPIDWPEDVNKQLDDAFNHRARERDPFWKLITPRFVTSEDGRFMWKCDTSSDELVGHYFLYSVYYDLVAKTEEEKTPVREVVRDITDHLIRNGFNLVDHDGKPTRWGRFGPDFLDTAYGWDQRGLNSLQMLSMLSVAEHVTGDPKYGAVAKKLRDEHHYHINAMHARDTFPPDNVVPWDNNLALMAFYPLMQYERDPELMLLYGQSIHDAWLFASKQKNPFWNLLYSACMKQFADLAAKNAFDNAYPEAGPYAKSIVADLLKFDPAIPPDTLNTLAGVPLELIGWKMENSHRLDVHLDTTPGQKPGYGWSRLDGKAIPIEERSHVRQDRDGFALDASEDNGFAEHEGTFYLLPYYLGRYHRFF